ncbi:MAG: YceI family protein [Pseudomonadota bacterium]
MIDYDKSELGFAGAQNGTKFNGAFTKWTASINLDPNDLSNASIETSVDLASATTGDKQKDRALPGSDWFDVKQTPTATFKSTKISNLNGNSYQAVGTLSLKGVSKSITLPFTLMIDGRTAKAQGKTSLIRMDYNIGEGEFANGKWVDANVDVTVSITAAKP